MLMIRDLMNGPKGGFAKALLSAHESPTLDNLVVLRMIADGENRVVLDGLFPGLRHMQVLSEVWGADHSASLAVGFPMLQRLEEEADREDPALPPRAKQTEEQVQRFYDTMTAVERQLRDRGPIIVAAPDEEAPNG